ncbi:NUDIX domain-containing protein [Sphaerimonospora cavernae]|uniref:NUDIX domain-containing protein n=1 Tax=Sphaerimonospora cavernae TaxID=1740611 RepID=A0ABV6U3Q2_9ACTN
MPPIVKRNVRVILLDGEDLVLIKRTRPGRDPYWVTVGGGLEETDDSLEAALCREVFEELGGTITAPQLVFLITDSLDSGLGVQHIFAARLNSIDLATRTGTEFSKPERGGYEVVRVPLISEAVRAVALMPPELGEFIAANIDAITSVVDQEVRTA